MVPFRASRSFNFASFEFSRPPASYHQPYEHHCRRRSLQLKRVNGLRNVQSAICIRAVYW